MFGISEPLPQTVIHTRRIQRYLYDPPPYNRRNLYARVCGEDLEPDDDRRIIEKRAEVKQCLQKLYLPVSFHFYALYM